MGAPCAADSIGNQPDETTGRFAQMAASHAASALFLYRAGRPDLADAARRLCAKVEAWTTVHDKALTRLMLYAACTQRAVLLGFLAPADAENIVIMSYSDADLNGDAESTRSVSCWRVETFSPETG